MVNRSNTLGGPFMSSATELWDAGFHEDLRLADYIRTITLYAQRDKACGLLMLPHKYGCYGNLEFLLRLANPSPKKSKTFTKLFWFCLSDKKDMADNECVRSATKFLRNIFLLVFVICSVLSVEPSFDVPVINVTSVTGHTAVLPCSVEYLGEHKVVWTDPWNTILSLDDRRITDDDRISVERPYTKDWNLHIREVIYKDRGQYTCQLNTDPIKTKTIILHVL
ncbi:hypothetical protein ScPMuIL_017613, partial [Solemya velum]